MASAAPSTGRYRLAIASRSLAAILGSYGLAVLTSLAITAGLANVLGARDAVTLGRMIGFLVYAGAAIWAFGCRSAESAWTGIGLASALAALGLLAAGGAA
ncbi:hypothetical protein B2G71_04980 [Novosphingobium sp. PC22D]|uniref:iron transporter n=1 Tax=Novosphingobium sp. PC22D TaxID=1962403 RepID=UPI000BEFF80F|nr:iron transporter [Novosphingobium sp. PC22D]PEQ13678.1 hypothetical protein B2G71_04980 [Novosphingobium sp. PC22D]